MSDDSTPFPGWPYVVLDEDWGSEHGTKIEVDIDVFDRDLCVVVAMEQRGDDVVAELSPDKAERLGRHLIDAAEDVRRRLAKTGAS